MVWLGLLLGLLAYQAARIALPGEPPPFATPGRLPVVNPYEEAERSREILEAQDRRPENLLERPAGPGAPAGGQRASAAGVRVIDGDTFDYGGMRVRIADIDTPEIEGRCAAERDMARRATRRLGALLAAGPFELHPIPGRDEDRYGRKLRIVTRGGASIGDRLVAEGLARTWSGRREPWC